MQCEDLRLTEPLRRAVREAGYRRPTPIQAGSIRHVLTGRDLLACAPTSTGMTVAIALPILQKLSSARRTRPGAVRTQVMGRNAAMVHRHGNGCLTVHGPI